MICILLGDLRETSDCAVQEEEASYFVEHITYFFLRLFDISV